jgi:hypothetical protein
MLIERLTITFDPETGHVKGGMAIPWDATQGALNPIDLPTGSAQSLKALGGLADQIAEINSLKSELKTLERVASESARIKDATIEQLQTQLSPDIASLIGPLRSAGLDAWGDAAVTAGENLMPLVLELLAIASQPANWSQCQQIKDLFGAICQQSGVLPTQEQAIAMQAILDNGSPTTGPVGNDWLRFV